MEKFEKSLFVIFFILLVISIIASIISYKNIYSLLIMAGVLLFNAGIFILILWGSHVIKNITHKDYLIFTFFLLLVFLLYGYFLSVIFKISYGNFISFGGLFFFIIMMSKFILISVIIVSVLIVVGGAALLFYLHKKEFKTKVVYQKRYIVLILALLILGTLLIPRTYIDQSSPAIAALKKIIKPSWFGIHGKVPSSSKEKVLNIKPNIKDPNIIILLLESVPAEHITYYGYERNITPNIDQLAKENIVFKKAYASASHTNHAQPTLLASRYSLINKYGNNFKKEYPSELIWTVLKKEGYNTSFISGADTNLFNLKEYLQTEDLDLYWDSSSDEKFDYNTGIENKDYDEKVVNKAIEWISSINKSRPFIATLNLQENHYPYPSPENESIFFPTKDQSLLTSYLHVAEEDWIPTINRYDNALHYTDKQIGKLLEYLKKE